MATVSAVVGAVTPTTARVTAKVDNGPVRIATSLNSDLSSPTFHGPETVDADGVATVDLTGLSIDTRYFWAVEDNGALDTSITGQVLTDPLVGDPASFTIALCGDAGLDPDVPGVAGDAPERLSNHPVHDTIRSRALAANWRRTVHLGDICYYDLGSGNHGLSSAATAAQYRSMWDDILSQPVQAALYRDVPWVYIWDDHDFGPNNSDSTAPGRDNAVAVYRERIPHYNLGSESSTGAVFHSFQIGRVLFVVSDTRADRLSPTMLGDEQKSWLNGVLGASNAELLVWLMPTPWIGLASDTWAGFEDERAELVQMLDDRGWLGRTCMVSADKHVLALESGSGGNEAFGGFPIMLCASLDASPGTTTDQYDLGMRPGRNQYGTLAVEDGGNQIQVTLTGWIGESQWSSHTFTVSTDPDPGPEPPPSPPPVATAAIRTRVTWLGCRLTDGRIISEIPDITGEVKRVLGDVTTNSLTLPIPLSGPGALPIGLVEQLTEPGRAMIAAVVNDIPTWAGIVGISDGGTRDTMDLPVASLEAYLERRIVRDHEFSQVDEATIAATLVGDAGDIPGVGSGIGLTIDAPPTGTLRDREYLLTDRKTVFEALQELMGVLDGPEWTIDLDWTDNTHTAIAKIFRVRKRIGVAAASPHAVFDSESSSEARYRYRIDYTLGHGANYVVAYSSGQAEDQPFSAPAIAAEVLDAGYPIYEEHFQPSSNITSQDVLDDHAAAELDRRRLGTRTFTLEARWDAYPRYGVDWQLGDDIAWQLKGHRHPQGTRGQGRAIGFTLDMQTRTIRPILEGEQ